MNPKYVVPRYLCTRCGACIAACPSEALALDELDYPTLLPGRCTDCGLCGKVCPRVETDFPTFTYELFQQPFSLGNKLGVFQKAYVGFVSNPGLRLRASSGGVITGLLLWLLEEKIIHGSIVTISGRAHAGKAIAILGRTRQDFLEGAQSKYTVVSMAQAFRQLLLAEGAFAFVGLPCHIHAFRKLCSIYPRLSAKVLLVIGLYCGGAMEHKAAITLSKRLGVAPSEVRQIEYRAGEWPGKFQVHTEDGSIHSIPADIHRFLNRLYYARGCLPCIDYSAEMSDMSVADAWTREGSDWKFPRGQSIVLVRTRKAQEILDNAMAEGFLKMQRIPETVAIATHVAMADSRRMQAYIRIPRLRKLNSSYLNFHISSFPEIPKKQFVIDLIKSSSMFMGRFHFTRVPIEKLAFKLVKEMNQESLTQTASIRKKLWSVTDILLRRWFRW